MSWHLCPDLLDDLLLPRPAQYTWPLIPNRVFIAAHRFASPVVAVGDGEFSRSLQHPLLMRGVVYVIEEGTDCSGGTVLGIDGPGVDADRGL